jgi:hypothetical protein
MIDKEFENGYDYEEAVKDDFYEYVRDTFETDYDSFEDAYDEALCSDSVIGNASGSYYCSTYKAKEALFFGDGYEIIQAYLYDFGEDSLGHRIDDFEALDVIARWWTLNDLYGKGELEEIYKEAIDANVKELEKADIDFDEGNE